MIKTCNKHFHIFKSTLVSPRNVLTTIVIITVHCHLPLSKQCDKANILECSSLMYFKILS
ncbi:hypothetical protein BLOT_005207 [Blomia tropicalis]|nr:hypothetical protein BLOT_005207 [Blomia tropicalis]